MANRKAHVKSGRAARTKRNSTARPKSWSNAHRLALRLALISFFGLVVPAAFANWDKFVPRRKSNLDEVSVRTMLFEQRKAKSLALLSAAEVTVDEGMKAVRESNDLSLPEKETAASVGEELKATIRTHRLEIQYIFDRWFEAIKTDNSVESDMRQKELLDKILDLQWHFDQKIEPTPLRDHMRDVRFGCIEENKRLKKLLEV